jgi:phosphate ABC transporter phosphate-binding protein
MTRARAIAAAVLALLTMAVVATAPLPADATVSAGKLVPISGAGSTWSQNAVDQWRRNVNQFGMKVNFTGTGSSDGRNQFRNNTVDFAVSEIPFGLTDNGVVDNPGSRGFAYMPIVAGGTAFMYNLKAGGKRITNLRLTGEQVTKIFTGVITRWDDPVLKAENPGLAMPARPIVPVVRSDGSGTSAQFSLWMSKQYPTLWDDYCKKFGRPTPCGQTSSYPSKAPFLSLAGSLGVSGYVSQDKNEGTITYVEDSYALNTGFPVVKVLNKANYYVEPTAGNVAVALTKASINADLTQNLDGVYNNADKRAYPLSSYSYMIVPTKIEGPITADKGYTLSQFAGYFLCEGQAPVDKLGYSPLPKNLVQAGLDVIKKIPGFDPAKADIKNCKVTTLDTKSAPNPLECDRKGGPSQCTTGTGGSKSPTQPSGGTNNGGTGGTSDGATGGTNTGGTGGTPTTGGVVTPAPVVTDPNTGTTTDPGVGQVPTVTDPNTGQPTGNLDGNVTANASNLTGGTGNGLNGVLVVFALVLLMGLIVGPPMAARSIERQRRLQQQLGPPQ